MDPISFAVELEIGSFLIAVVGAAATWLHHRHSRARRSQSERHYQGLLAQRERQHREHMSVMRGEERATEAGQSALAEALRPDHPEREPARATGRTERVARIRRPQ